MRESAHGPYVLIDTGEQEGIGEQIELEGVPRGERETCRLDPPARISRNAAIELLDQHESDDGVRQPGDEHRPQRQQVASVEGFERERRELACHDHQRQQRRPAQPPGPQRPREDDQEPVPGAATKHVERHDAHRKQRARLERRGDRRCRPQARYRHGGEEHPARQRTPPGKEDVEPEEEVGESRKAITPGRDFSHAGRPRKSGANRTRLRSACARRRAAQLSVPLRQSAPPSRSRTGRAYRAPASGS